MKIKAFAILKPNCINWTSFTKNGWRRFYSKSTSMPEINIEVTQFLFSENIRKTL